MGMKLITVVTPCYNDDANVEEIYGQVKNVFDQLKQYDYEHIFMDNASQEGTLSKLKGIAAKDPKAKLIVSTRNFGEIRSSFYGLLQGKGDATILIGADLQDPPALIAEFIQKWEQGHKIVAGVKKQHKESFITSAFRSLYYGLMKKASEVQMIKNFAGFGLYDRAVVDILKKINDPYPDLRGLVCEVGFEKAIVEYVPLSGKGSRHKKNFYALYDLAMLGMTNQSKVPLRIATMVGFVVSAFSLVVALGYLVWKLIFWFTFEMGMAPLLIGIFFVGGVQLFFLGVIGEYVGSINTQVLKRPLVIEKERINF